jgi:hypothetical protein
MPTRTLYRIWCKSCNEFTLHGTGFEDKITTCNTCKTEYTEVYLRDIPKDKLLAQRERYKARNDFFDTFLSMAQQPSSLYKQEYDTKIIESDAGLKSIREERSKRYEEQIKLKKLQEEEELKYKNVGRNDDCLCKSGKKYKKCCLIRIQNITK